MGHAGGIFIPQRTAKSVFLQADLVGVQRTAKLPFERSAGSPILSVKPFRRTVDLWRTMFISCDIELGTALLTHPNGRKEERSFLLLFLKNEWFQRTVSCLSKDRCLVRIESKSKLAGTFQIPSLLRRRFKESRPSLILPGHGPVHR